MRLRVKLNPDRLASVLTTALAIHEVEARPAAYLNDLTAVSHP